MNETVIITPELTPGSGGLADYTLRLLETWNRGNQIKPLTPSANELVPASAAKILVQYSAYGFDRFGYPRKLISALINWKRQTRGRLVIMFHEIWAAWPIYNKNAVVQFFHRRALGRLVECADEVFTATASQASHLQNLVPGKSIQVLPIAPSIRGGSEVDLARIHGVAVLFGLQETRIRALKKLHQSLRALSAAGRITKIITVGTGSPSRDPDERTLLVDLGLKEGFEQRGQQSENEISRLLSTASFGISDQDELSYTKSGTFMAYASHGLNVLNEYAAPSKPEPFGFLVSPSELLHELNEGELNARSGKLQAWQQHASSWESVAAKLGKALQLQ